MVFINLKIKTVVMFLSRSSTVSQQESFSGFAYVSKWATAWFFKLMHSARYSSKWDKTHGLAVIWLVQKCWEMLGRGILLTHNARQQASRPLQLCCMTWPTQVKISRKQRHTYKLEHRIINKDLYINNDINILWTCMMNKLSCLKLHELAWFA